MRFYTHIENSRQDTSLKFSDTQRIETRSSIDRHCVLQSARNPTNHEPLPLPWRKQTNMDLYTVHSHNGAVKLGSDQIEALRLVSRTLDYRE